MSHCKDAQNNIRPYKVREVTEVVHRGDGGNDDDWEDSDPEVKSVDRSSPPVTIW